VEDLILAYGGPGLGLVSFIAATLLPFSSEAALFAAVRLGLPPSEAFAWASLGNCLGVILNYALGFWGSQTFLEKTIASRGGRRAIDWSNRFGKWSLLFSWLPFIGDPLTIVAGILRVDFLFFLVVVCCTRVLRYGLLLAFL
jgi:membrane protein YqaA with SNARE-associated domain